MIFIRLVIVQRIAFFDKRLRYEIFKDSAFGKTSQCPVQQRLLCGKTEHREQKPGVVHIEFEFVFLAIRVQRERRLFDILANVAILTAISLRSSVAALCSTISVSQSTVVKSFSVS